MSTDMRRQLRSAVRSAWDSDAGASLADALEQAARPGYASCLEEAFKTGATRDKYESCAKTHNLASAYRQKWGKPA